MEKPLFTGVCTALVTPFFHNEINFPMLEQLLRRQIAAGIRAVVLSGTTGESATLTDKEKEALFLHGRKYTKDQCLMIAGTGSNSTSHTIELSIAAKELGADALLLVTPYYNKTTPSGLFEHFLTVAQSVDLPIILYNVPSRTGVDTPISVYRALSEVPNIVGVKEASCDITKVTRIKMACDPHFSVWAGNDDQIVPVIASGGSGVISVLSNIFPEKSIQICQAAFQNDYQTASTLLQNIMPMIDLLFCEVNPMPVKAILKQIGYDCGNCRLPLTNLSHENQLKITSYLSHLEETNL